MILAIVVSNQAQSNCADCARALGVVGMIIGGPSLIATGFKSAYHSVRAKQNITNTSKSEKKLKVAAALQVTGAALELITLLAFPCEIDDKRNSRMYRRWNALILNGVGLAAFIVATLHDRAAQNNLKDHVALPEDLARAVGYSFASSVTSLVLFLIRGGFVAAAHRLTFPNSDYDAV